MSVTLYQMRAFDRWQQQKATKKAQQERQAQVMPLMKKPQPQQQARLF